jgi:nitroreductase
MKIAHTQYPVHQLIRKRWSARAFSPDAITPEERNTLLEAAAWAPSSMNEQPWRYYFAHRGEPAFELMADCLLPGNEPWARKAALMLLCLCDTRFKRNDKENRHAMHDTGAANTQLLLQAAEMEIYGHMMGGYDAQRTADNFAIPPNHEIVCFMALGRRDTPETLEEPYRTREITPRTRLNLNEFAGSAGEILKI